MKTTLRFSFLLPIAFALQGCGSDSLGSGTVNFLLTDAPACGYDHVYVTVERVRVHRSESALDNSEGWHEIVLPAPQKIDLLDLTNGALATLGQSPLPAGHYQQIRLVLAPNHGNALNNSIVPSGGSEQPLATPSAAQSGYKVVGNFGVQPDTLVDLVLDFDACRSIVEKGNGGYALKPVVKATTMIISGSITGYVAPADAGAMVYAEQNGEIIKGTVADSGGRFVLSPVVQSTSNGPYDIVITRANDTTVIVRGVPVAAGADTAVSTAGTPFSLPGSTMRNVVGVVTPASAEAGLEARQATGGGTYTVGLTNANLDTGTYGLSLPIAAPLVGNFTGVLPVTLATDATAAGQYSIRATTMLGAVQSIGVDLLAGDANNVNFAF